MKKANRNSVAAGIKSVLLTLIIIFGAVEAGAQVQLTGKEQKKRLEQLTSDYFGWQTAQWQGKVKSDMLPLTVTAKVFLRHDKEILISLRAPLIGEAARIEIDPDSVLVVNKMKKVYYKGSVERINHTVPNLYESLQSLLIGRAFVLGEGELSKDHSKYVNMYDLNESYTLVAPYVPTELENFTYGFALDPQYRLNNIFMEFSRVEQNESEEPDTIQIPRDEVFELSAAITHENKDDVNADVVLQLKGMRIAARIEGGEIEWGAPGFDRINISKGYKPTNLKGCLSF